MSNLYSILIELCIKEMLDMKEFGRSEADQPMNRFQPWSKLKLSICFGKCLLKKDNLVFLIQTNLDLGTFKIATTSLKAVAQWYGYHGFLGAHQFLNNGFWNPSILES